MSVCFKKCINLPVSFNEMSDLVDRNKFTSAVTEQ